MHYKFKVFLFVVFCAFTNVQAQYYMNSPYTRFGFGDINRIGFGQNRGLGGITAGYRVPNNINYLNPASYTSLDTLSFIFDVGLLGNIVKVESSSDQSKSKTGYVDHVAILFPATRWLAFSVGIVPFSRVGYDLQVTATDEYNVSIQKEYTGNGGLNQFYIGSSVKLNHHFALGANFSYLFGNIQRKTSVTVTNDPFAGLTIFDYNTFIHNIVWNFGMQYFTNIGNKGYLVLGAELDNKSKLHTRYTGLVSRVETYTPADTLNYDYNPNYRIILPARIGLGFTYTYDQRLMVGFDLIKQNWSNSKFFDNSDTLMKDETTYRLGIEYNPVPITVNKHVNYLGRIKYRVGGFYGVDALELNQTRINSYGFSFGLGLPWKNERKLFTRTMFNINYELVFKGTTENQLLKEKQQYFTIGLTLHDFWFFKPKYD